MPEGVSGLSGRLHSRPDWGRLPQTGDAMAGAGHDLLVAVVGDADQLAVAHRVPDDRSRSCAYGELLDAGAQHVFGQDGQLRRDVAVDLKREQRTRAGTDRRARDRSPPRPPAPAEYPAIRRSTAVAAEVGRTEVLAAVGGANRPHCARRCRSSESAPSAIHEIALTSPARIVSVSASSSCTGTVAARSCRGRPPCSSRRSAAGCRCRAQTGAAGRT